MTELLSFSRGENFIGCEYDGTECELIEKKRIMMAGREVWETRWRCPKCGNKFYVTIPRLADKLDPQLTGGKLDTTI